MLFSLLPRCRATHTHAKQRLPRAGKSVLKSATWIFSAPLYASSAASSSRAPAPFRGRPCNHESKSRSVGAHFYLLFPHTSLRILYGELVAVELSQTRVQKMRVLPPQITPRVIAQSMSFTCVNLCNASQVSGDNYTIFGIVMTGKVQVPRIRPLCRRNAHHTCSAILRASATCCGVHMHLLCCGATHYRHQSP